MIQFRVAQKEFCGLVAFAMRKQYHSGSALGGIEPETLTLRTVDFPESPDPRSKTCLCPCLHHSSNTKGR